MAKRVPEPSTICFDAQEYVFPDRVELVPVPRQGIDPQAYVERRWPVIGETNPDRVVVDPGMGVQHFRES